MRKEKLGVRKKQISHRVHRVHREFRFWEKNLRKSFFICVNLRLILQRFLRLLRFCKENRFYKKILCALQSSVRNLNCAFTFAETLAVLAITVILTSQAGIAAHHLVQKARVSSAKNQIEQFKVALQSYYVDCGRFPTSEQGLDALFSKPELHPVSESWDGPYLDKKIGKDPWGDEYKYFYSKSAGFPSDAPEGLPFAIVCFGADGQEGGDGVEKDIWSWN